MLTIRKMKMIDYHEVDRLMQKLHKLHVEARPDLFADKEHPYSLDEYFQIVASEEIISYIAQWDNEIAGLAITQMRDKSMMVDQKIAYMDDLIVDEKFRGRGIAKALVKASEEEAKRLGAKRLDLMVWAFNENAVQFYRSLGLEVQRYILEKELE